MPKTGGLLRPAPSPHHASRLRPERTNPMRLLLRSSPRDLPPPPDLGVGVRSRFTVIAGPEPVGRAHQPKALTAPCFFAGSRPAGSVLDAMKRSGPFQPMPEVELAFQLRRLTAGGSLRQNALPAPGQRFACRIPEAGACRERRQQRTAGPADLFTAAVGPPPVRRLSSSRKRWGHLWVVAGILQGRQPLSGLPSSATT